MPENTVSTSKTSNSGRGLVNVIDGIPILGHIKGIYHYSKHDLKNGKAAISAATRSVVVVVGGFGGREIGGWMGAAGAGIVSGTGYDFFVSVMNEKPYGFFAVLKNASENPSFKTFISAALVPIADALSGSLTVSISPYSLQTIDAAKFLSLGALGACSPPVFIEKSQPKETLETHDPRTPEITLSEYDMKIPKIILPPAMSESNLSEYDMDESVAEESTLASLDVTNHNHEDDDDKNGMDPETVLSFITSRVKMHDPVTNKAIFPLVSILDLPEEHFDYTSVAKVNNVHRGILNLMFRQSAELERFISDFSVDALPLTIRKIVRMLQTAPDLKAKELLNALDKQLVSNPTLKKLATQYQLKILDFLSEYMSEDHYVGELVDNRGRNRSVWRVYNNLGGEEAMITPFASALNKPTPEIRRPFREIVSFSFAPLTAVQSKMKKIVMAGDWSSTCSSSSKLSY